MKNITLYRSKKHWYFKAIFIKIKVNIFLKEVKILDDLYSEYLCVNNLEKVYVPKLELTIFKEPLSFKKDFESKFKKFHYYQIHNGRILSLDIKLSKDNWLYWDMLSKKKYSYTEKTFNRFNLFFVMSKKFYIRTKKISISEN